MSDDTNAYTPPETDPAKPEPASRSGIVTRLLILGACFLGATYLVAYPGNWHKPPVSFGELIAMIPTAPMVLISGVLLPSLGNPMVVGPLLGAPLILLSLFVIAKFFHREPGKQMIAAIGLGVLNGIAARVCFFIVHGLST